MNIALEGTLSKKSKTEMRFNNNEENKNIFFKWQAGKINS